MAKRCAIGVCVSSAYEEQLSVGTCDTFMTQRSLHDSHTFSFWPLSPPPSLPSLFLFLSFSLSLSPSPYLSLSLPLPLSHLEDGVQHKLAESSHTTFTSVLWPFSVLGVVELVTPETFHQLGCLNLKLFSIDLSKLFQSKGPSMETGPKAYRTPSGINLGRGGKKIITNLLELGYYFECISNIKMIWSNNLPSS